MYDTYIYQRDVYKFLSLIEDQVEKDELKR